jgi:acyl phosphate:glycerol-3-phosphate acyltransferase
VRTALNGPDEWLAVGLALLLGYLAGSIPFGVVVAKCLGTVDPREAGSRNIGFTNVLRVAGKPAAALTLIGDLGKGWAAAWGGAQVFEAEAIVLLVALTPILGHLFPVFLGFRGGKGVATALGAVTGVAPWLGLLLLATWLAAAAVWRYSSGAALTAFGLLPVAALIAGKGAAFVVFTLAVTGLIVWRHQDNVQRLLAGTEAKLGRSKT